MGAFDIIVAAMRCPVCGELTPLDGSTEMQTRLRAEPDGSYIGVGDLLPTDPRRARDYSYLVVREPLPGEDVVLLHTWRCPACGTAFQWAEIVVHDGRIASIEVPQRRLVRRRSRYGPRRGADPAGVHEPIAAVGAGGRRRRRTPDGRDERPRPARRPRASGSPDRHRGATAGRAGRARGEGKTALATSHQDEGYAVTPRAEGRT